MKVIPLSEAKTNLSRYGRLCHTEPVVVTVNGKPLFQLAPLEEDDDLMDLAGAAEGPSLDGFERRVDREESA